MQRRTEAKIRFMMASFRAILITIQDARGMERVARHRPFPVSALRLRGTESFDSSSVP